MAIEDLQNKQDLANFVKQLLDQQPKGSASFLLHFLTVPPNFGTATMTWAAGQVSNNTTVPHGLKDSQGNGKIPVAVLASMSSAGPWAVIQPGTLGTTNFVLSARTVDGTAPTGSWPAYWLALA